MFYVFGCNLKRLKGHTKTGTAGHSIISSNTYTYPVIFFKSMEVKIFSLWRPAATVRQYGEH